MTREFLAIRNLTKIYNPGSAGEIVALKDFSLVVEESEFVTIIGSNAAGKTTLFDLIMGSVLPTSGEIILDGISITGLPEFQRAKFIACVKQNPNESIIPSMTLAENLAIAKLKDKSVGLTEGVKLKTRQEFVGLLKPFRLGLEERLDDKIDYLSGGQKQIVALLMATIVKTKILLLDEYTTALDPNVGRAVLAITERLVREKKLTTLMITHNIHQAINCGDHIVLLERGKLGFKISGEQKLALNVADVEARLEGETTELGGYSLGG